MQGYTHRVRSLREKYRKLKPLTILQSDVKEQMGLLLWQRIELIVLSEDQARDEWLNRKNAPLSRPYASLREGSPLMMGSNGGDSTPVSQPQSLARFYAGTAGSANGVTVSVAATAASAMMAGHAAATSLLGHSDSHSAGTGLSNGGNHQGQLLAPSTAPSTIPISAALPGLSGDTHASLHALLSGPGSAHQPPLGSSVDRVLAQFQNMQRQWLEAEEARAAAHREALQQTFAQQLASLESCCMSLLEAEGEVLHKHVEGQNALLERLVTQQTASLSGIFS